MSSNRFNRNKWSYVDAVSRQDGTRQILDLLSDQFPEPQAFGHKIKVDMTEDCECSVMPLEKLLNEINSGVLKSPKLLLWLSSVFDEYF